MDHLTDFGLFDLNERYQKKEQELWQTSLEKLKKKLEDSELALRQHERDTAEMRSKS